MPTFKQNDILVNGKDKCKVLGVCGEVVFVSVKNEMEFPSSNLWNQYTLKNEGWTLEEKKWEPKKGEMYRYVNSYGTLDSSKYWLTSKDYFRQQTNNCFPHTDEGNLAAEAYRAKLISVMGGGE